MKNFAQAHNSYLEPPDDDPVCEDGCGDTLVKDFTGVWICENKFCPLKFQGVEKEMAKALVEVLDSLHYSRARNDKLRRENLELYEKLSENHHRRKNNE